MTYPFVFDIPGPVELYDAAHAELRKLPADGMLLHVARPTGDGVQVVEVWTSAGAFQEWMAAYGGPTSGALAAAGVVLPEVTPAPFEPAGLIVPAAGVTI
jgi:hypothetical protein